MADRDVDRREFLKLTAGGLISAGLSTMGFGQILSNTLAKEQSSDAVGKSFPLSTQSNPKRIFGKSPVVEVSSKRVICFDGFNRKLLQEMLINGLNELVGVTSFSKALNELFSKRDIIGFKFNSSHANLLNTNIPLAEEWLRLLVRYGYDPKRIIFIEVQPHDAELPPTPKVKFGWGPEVDFGSGKDQLISALDQVTALVNVGQLKANAIAGMSGCLKNMAYGVIKHPARYHANQCTPYIADIYNMPAIRGKVRLNVLSALRVLITAEKFNPNSVVEYRKLLFGHDVVAVDAVGYEWLDELRQKAKLSSLVGDTDFPKQLITAYTKKLGVFHPDQILIKQVDLN
jgi:uncharacterized protein DUF362